jgi:hypothetical protein
MTESKEEAKFYFRAFLCSQINSLFRHFQSTTHTTTVKQATRRRCTTVVIRMLSHWVFVAQLINFGRVPPQQSESVSPGTSAIKYSIIHVLFWSFKPRTYQTGSFAELTPKFQTCGTRSRKFRVPSPTPNDWDPRAAYCFYSGLCHVVIDEVSLAFPQWCEISSTQRNARALTISSELLG